MKITCLEKGVIYSEIEYEIAEDIISTDKKLSSIVKKHKKGKELTKEEKIYLYNSINCLGKVTSSEIIEYPDAYKLEEIQDYEE